MFIEMTLQGHMVSYIHVLQIVRLWLRKQSMVVGGWVSMVTFLKITVIQTALFSSAQVVQVWLNQSGTSVQWIIIYPVVWIPAGESDWRKSAEAQAKVHVGLWCHCWWETADSGGSTQLLLVRKSMKREVLFVYFCDMSKNQHHSLHFSVSIYSLLPSPCLFSPASSFPLTPAAFPFHHF